MIKASFPLYYNETIDNKAEHKESYSSWKYT